MQRIAAPSGELSSITLFYGNEEAKFPGNLVARFAFSLSNAKGTKRRWSFEVNIAPIARILLHPLAGGAAGGEKYEMVDYSSWIRAAVGLTNVGLRVFSFGSRDGLLAR